MDEKLLSKQAELEECGPIEIKVRQPEHKYFEADFTFEQSIRNKNLWVDSFFLYSLVWAFGSLLNEKARREFNTWLLTNIKTKD